MNYNKYIQNTIDLASFNTSNHSNSYAIYDIIIPIYNGFEALSRCIKSLLNHTNIRHKIFLYNDASTDLTVKPWLDKLAQQYEHISVIHNRKNLGYLKNVNQALTTINNDVVILNSDTQVTAGWLRQMAAIADDSKVAIVCPLSDNATILSLDKSVLSSIEHLSFFSGQWFALPTAVGSCMLIKKHIIQELGVFDEYYNPGYGEECDYSLRLRAKGYDIACAPAAFVYHKGAVSFAEQANILKQQHQKLLDLRWPDYNKEIQHFCENNPIVCVEEYLQQFSSNQRNKDTIIHVVHGIESQGGVEMFTKQLLNRLTDDIFNIVLLPSFHHIPGQQRVISQLSDKLKVINYQFFNRKAETKIANKNADLYQQQLDVMFVRYLFNTGAKLVHFHSVVGIGSLIWPQICQNLGIPYFISCHDHFSICYNFSLLKNNQTEYCAKTLCSPEDKECVSCLKQITNYSHYTTKDYITQRNEIWHDIMQHAAVTFVPDQYLKNLLKDRFNVLHSKNITELEPYFYPTELQRSVVTSINKLTIAYLGTFTFEKGAQVFLDAYKQLTNKNVGWKIIGHVHSFYSHQLSETEIKLTGMYQRGDLPTLLAEVDLVIIPSILPESYSITLTEAWLQNIPVICSDIGAIKSRITSGYNGQTFPVGNANALANAIEKLIDNQDLLLEMKHNIRATKLPSMPPSDKLGLIYKDYLSKTPPLSFKASMVKNHIPMPAFNAFSIMHKWLYSEMTLEAEADWKTPKDIDIVIIGTHQHLCEKSLHSCKTYAPQSKVFMPLLNDSIDHESTALCILIEGQRLNDNFGNWADEFRASKKWLSLADYALIDQNDEIYAPQFLADFDVFSYLRQKNRNACMLINPQRCDQSLAQIITKVCHNKLKIQHLIDKMIEINLTHKIHYFPHISYLFDDIQWAQHWKTELIFDLDKTQQRTLRHNLTKSPSAISIFLLSKLNKDKVSTLIDMLDCQQHIKIYHIYVFCPNKMDFSDNDHVSAHYIDFNQPEVFINPIAKRDPSKLLLFIHDNIELHEPNTIRIMHDSIGWHGIHALSPLVYPKHDDYDYAIANKVGNGQIAGQGVIRDMRFDHQALPITTQLLDEDFFLISRSAWSKINGLQAAGNVYFRATGISQNLFKNNLSMALLPIKGIHKKRLPSFCIAADYISLKSQRAQLYKSNPEFYLQSHYYSKAYNSQFDCQLDENFGTFKTPKNKPRVLAFSNDSWASGFYRVKAPISALVADNRVSSHFLPEKRQSITANYFEINKQSPDVLLLHNFLDDIQLLALKQYKQHLNIPLILSMDDLLNEIPAYNPFSQSNPAGMSARIEKALSLVDRVIVSTNFLASKLSQHHDDIRVINNFLPKELWKHDLVHRQPPRKPRIGWAGAAQHQADLDWLLPVIAATSKQLQWVFYGYLPHALRSSDVEFHHHTPLGVYHTKLKNLNLDIAIAPLVDNSFNQAKSHLKLLEYGALGIATICSDVENYKHSPAQKLANNPQLWIDHILELTNDSDKRQALGAAMHQWVNNNNFLEDNLEVWAQALYL